MTPDEEQQRQNQPQRQNQQPKTQEKSHKDQGSQTQIDKGAQTQTDQHPYQQYSGKQQERQYVPENQRNPYYVQYVAVASPTAANKTPMVRRADSFRDQQQRTEGEEPEGWQGFTDEKVRSIFIRKVYILLMLQLLFTFAIIALFIFEPNVKRFVQENLYLYLISLAVFIGVYIGLVCFESVRRKYPTNIIVLCIFTLAMSYMMGVLSSFHDTEAVLMAVGITAVVCLAVSVFSFHTKFDFTSCGGILCILLIILILFGLIAIFFPSKIMTIIYASLGAIVFTLFLAYDTQMLMGGKKMELSPEEHIFATVQLYMDIILIFQYILLIFAAADS